MNIQEKIEELEKQLQKLKEEFNKIEGEEFPKDGDKYYWIDELGYIATSTWSDCDYHCLEIGNAFKAEEDAKFMVERLKVIQELKKFSGKFECRRENYYIHFDYMEEKLLPEWEDYHKFSTIYFNSREMAEKAIEVVGEERIKKYYLGIEEGDED